MNLFARFKFGLLAVCLTAAPLLGLRAAAEALPYKFLLVVDDQWKDPASEIIEDAGEFSMVCALLKSWGLPFEIYRLDQQRFDAYHLLDGFGVPRHSTIIWDAPGARLGTEEAKLLRSLVVDHGVGFVAFGDTVSTPVVSELLGVRVTGKYRSSDPLVLAGEDFITRGVAEREPAPLHITPLLRGSWTQAMKLPIGGTVAALDPGVRMLGRRDDHAAVTARGPGPAGKTVWLDPDRASGQIFRQRWRELFKRALIWANGYALYAEYPRSVMLSMDDMGASDKTFYPGWHYRSLSEELIQTGIIDPLKRHRAVMVENVVSGFVDRRTHRILDPWTQSHVVDELDPSIVHDYTSTKRGLDDGIKEGVFEIQCHGWTHMAPDLDSPPGPLWSASPIGLVVQQNWYKEFGDYIRKSEIPAIVQRIHLHQGIDSIEKNFGVRPVALITGGGYSSHTLANNTMRLAAEAGFGFAQSESIFYLDHELCVTLEPVTPRVQWQYDQPLTADSMPWTNDAPTFLGFHDRDVAMDSTSVARLLDALGPGVRYMTFAEYCAYLHTSVTAKKGARSELTLEVNYGPEYCGFFQTHRSQWILHLSDETRAQLKRPAPERQLIRFDPGLGAKEVHS